MKYLMFKSESGDAAYAICVIDDLTVNDDTLEEIVKKNVGDNFDGEDLWGDWWIEEFTETKLTDLLGANMKPIIKYQVFLSTEAFEEFQTENDVSISTIMPILSNINAKESEANLDMNTQFACFVTYWENN